MNTDKIIAEKIASEYAPKTTSKVIALKKLDRKAKRTANIFGYTFGTVCSLILGTGMSFAMGVIGNDSTTSMIVGIVVVLLVLMVGLCFGIVKIVRKLGVFIDKIKNLIKSHKK